VFCFFFTLVRPFPPDCLRDDLEIIEEVPEDFVRVEGDEYILVRNAVVSGHSLSKLGKRGIIDLVVCLTDDVWGTG
jgi:hypothetical protein